MHDVRTSSDGGATKAGTVLADQGMADQGTTDQGPAAPLVVRAGTPGEMKHIGAVLARLLRPGDAVLLGGELGAGKTTLTQGMAAELGVGEPVTSPTFVLVHSYRTAAGWDLLHADVWRLEHLHEVIDLALPELLEDGAVAVVEWGERAAPALAPDWLEVVIGYDSEGVDERARSEARSGSNTPPTGQARREGQTPVPRPGDVPGADGRRLVVFRALGPSWQARMPELSKLGAGRVV